MTYALAASCCGLLINKYCIWLHTDNMYSMSVIARAFDKRYVPTAVTWEVSVETVEMSMSPRFFVAVRSKDVHKTKEDMEHDVVKLVASIEYWSKPEFYDYFKYMKYRNSERRTCTYIEKAPEIPIEVFQTAEIKGCQALPNAPKVSEDVIKATSVTSKDIMEAYYAIQKQRIEDNKSLFERTIDKLRTSIKNTLTGKKKKK